MIIMMTIMAMTEASSYTATGSLLLPDFPAI